MSESGGFSRGARLEKLRPAVDVQARALEREPFDGHGHADVDPVGQADVAEDVERGRFQRQLQRLDVEGL